MCLCACTCVRLKDLSLSVRNLLRNAADFTHTAEQTDNYYLFVTQQIIERYVDEASYLISLDCRLFFEAI